MKIKVITYTLFLLISKFLSAQPGDSHYSIVIYDHNNSGFIDCNVNLQAYQVYACNIEYLSNDFLQTSWTPDFKTLEVTDTLICNTTNDTLFPFKTLYIGKSYSNSRMLLVIKNGKDTMFIDGAGEHLISDHYGTQNKLPAIVPFNKGITKLFNLQKEDNYRILQNISFRKFWTTKVSNIPVYNPWIKRISSLSINKEKYNQNDTLILEITGKTTTDGGCNDGNVLWVLQKKEGDNWVSIKENMVQMDCGMGRNTFDHKQLPLFIITNKINSEMHSFPFQIELNSGKYRVYIFDDIGLPYFTETFEI